MPQNYSYYRRPREVPVENRREVRLPIPGVEVRIGTAQGPVLGKLRDISKSGAFIETLLNPRHTQFRLTFLVEDFQGIRQIRTFAQWVRADAAGIGVQFLAIEDEDVAALLKLAAESARDGRGDEE